VSDTAVAAMLTPNGAAESTNKCATLPSGLAAVPPQTQHPSSTANVTGSTAGDPALDWTANIDVLMRPHSVDLSSLGSTLSNSHRSTTGQTWEKFD